MAEGVVDEVLDVRVYDQDDDSYFIAAKRMAHYMLFDYGISCETASSASIPEGMKNAENVTLLYHSKLNDFRVLLTVSRIVGERYVFHLLNDEDTTFFTSLSFTRPEVLAFLTHTNLAVHTRHYFYDEVDDRLRTFTEKEYRVPLRRPELNNIPDPDAYVKCPKWLCELRNIPYDPSYFEKFEK